MLLDEPLRAALRSSMSDVSVIATIEAAVRR